MATRTRVYQRTHDWITFDFDINRLKFRTSYLLGMVQAKCEQIAGVPLSPEYAGKMHTIYLAKGVHATVAIEGNTLTEEEVQQILNKSLDLPPSTEYLQREAQNIIDACNAVRDRVFNNEFLELSVEEIKRYNRMVLEGLPVEPEVKPGEFRQHPAGVFRYAGAPPEDIPYLTNLLCEWLNRLDDSSKDLHGPIGILKAILAHLYIEWIHPFGDGNGRTGRLVELSFLLSIGMPTVVAHLLTNHYNQTRNEYYRYLDMSSKMGNDGVYEFVKYALQGFVDQLNSQIEYVQKDQIAVHWESFVYKAFSSANKSTTIERRQRQLVLHMSKQDTPIPLLELRHISPQVAESYANKTQRTVMRDVRELEKMMLVTVIHKDVIANVEMMRAFLPSKHDSS